MLVGLLAKMGNILIVKPGIVNTAIQNARNALVGWTPSVAYVI